ncbi:ABC transporter ATP-binding protein [Rhodococcus sp. ACPA4]|uniref:Peptide/nickel transport system ATP-binding protein n=2 Tax=Nocardiaceae TaxID=85025 RepID=A0A652YHN3_NOCGL|nr:MULTISPECIES: oligopeptide/dipeptide ABC transporter ATP-binding protein [Rhodococcus]NMD64332.1 ATP-binding cassette domain-containing protein [Nocardia globerula]MCE4265820.1 ATP-binding cassette domain-containing protein [Rhodococcus globerulus]MDV6270482.1 ATP-binding cassette domain-containing protein [Rhodococcus globerulus]MDV8071102.1 ATP-binding cassette domain-containing protein [Rhodococcus sp. IEGM 1366]PBC42970.1 ABC transporter ATP-binding protein [Rhodococcus sp. ACPA4]
MAGSGTAHLRDQDDVVLSVRNLVVEYAGRGGQRVYAVSDVSFDAIRGETIGLVGESGCGKSSVAKAIMQLPGPTSGSVEFDGVNVVGLKGAALRRQRRKIQMIFQDPISSLNPLRKVKDIIAEGLRIHDDLSKSEVLAKTQAMIERVGLDPDTAADRRPHEFSGGQCQRISIARAMVLDPEVIVCDEPVSALDVSVQAQIMNLLHEMKERYQLTMVFIAHDLAVVKNLSDRIVVMYLGKICEIGTSEELFSSPAHPYTRALAQSIPEPDPDAPIREAALSGDLPSPLNPPSGCRFRTRCPLAQEQCASDEPEIREVRPGRFVACHFPLDDSALLQATGQSSVLSKNPA